MNLLFYSALNASRFRLPSFHIAQPVSGRRLSNYEAVNKVLIFFRYFAPGRIKQYIDNCRRRNEDAARSILDSLPRGIDDFSAITYMMGSPAIKMRMAALLSCINSNAGPSLINHSFTWANTPQGRNVWETLDSLYENFHEFITSNHIPLDMPPNECDTHIYPMLRNDDSLRDYLVPLPESVNMRPRRTRRMSTNSFTEPVDIEPVETNDMRVESVQASRHTMSDIRYEGNNMYSYTGDDGQRHTITLTNLGVTVHDDGVASSTTYGTSGTI